PSSARMWRAVSPSSSAGSRRAPTACRCASLPERRADRAEQLAVVVAQHEDRDAAIAASTHEVQARREADGVVEPSLAPSLAIAERIPRRSRRHVALQPVLADARERA